MGYFKVTLDVDSDDTDESRLKIANIRPFGRRRPKSAEARFWERYFEHARLQAPSEWLQRGPPDITQLHAKIRKELPVPLKKALVDKLRILLKLPETKSSPLPSAAMVSAPADPGDGGTQGTSIPSQSAGAVASESARRQDIQQTLETLEIHVKAIKGGSLEILLFVLGFAKLLSETGISPDDFAKCLEIAAPAAMGIVFGTTVPLEADVEASPDEPDSGDADAAKEKPVMRLPVVQNPSGVSYFIPALVGVAAFGSAMWIFWTISSELAAERKELVAYVSKEAEDIGKERAAIAEKLATLLSTHDTALVEERKSFIAKSTDFLAALTKSQVDKDRAAAGSQKALFDAELEFVRKVDGASQAREVAVIDFVKSHLAPDTKQGPSPLDRAAANTCGQDSYTVRRRIQLALSERGLYTGAIDGQMGAKTVEGLRKFQVQASLPSTGTADSATLEKLGLHCETARVE